MLKALLGTSKGKQWACFRSAGDLTPAERIYVPRRLRGCGCPVDIPPVDRSADRAGRRDSGAILCGYSILFRVMRQKADDAF